MQIMELLQSGRTDEAMAILMRHLTARPNDVPALALLARILASQGRQNLAVSALQKIISLDPKSGNAYFGLAEMARSRGDFKEAERCYQKTIEFSVNDAVAPYHLGLMLTELDRQAEAKMAYKAAIERNPNFTEAIINLGNLDFLAGDCDAAKAHYLRALEIESEQPFALNGLGLIADLRGEIPEALSYFQAAITADPAHLPSLLAYAKLAGKCGEHLAEGISCCRTALAIEPDNVEIQGILGALLVKQGLDTEAIEAFRQAAKNGGRVEAGNLITLLIKKKRFDEALKIIEPLLAQHPKDTELLADTLIINLTLCHWTGLEQTLSSWTSAVHSAEEMVNPVITLGFPSVFRKTQLYVAHTFAQSLITRSLVHDLPLSDTPASPQERPLRIAYLSADFHQHATAYLLAGVLEAHDRGQVEVFCYSYGVDDQSDIRQRIRNVSMEFRDIARVPAAKAAQLIRDDRIDILVDLKGWSGGSRPEILLYRPAPILVNWLGYPGSMGDAALADYIIGDPIVTPVDHADGYAEKLALMPHSYQPNDRSRIVGTRPTRSDAGLPESGFIFCSFNQSYKITPEIFDIWCRLLDEVQGSSLWLLDPGEIAQANLQKEALQRGIDPNRLVFAKHLPATEHLGRLQLADLALDTLPVNSHTTCADALWAGVPLVTLIGETFAGRVAASLLTAAGLPELISDSLEHYYDLAYRLAIQSETLGAVKDKLRSGRETCELFNTKGFTLDLERLYRVMWRQQLAGSQLPIILEPR